VVVLITLVVRLALGPQYAEERRQIEDKARAARTHDLLRTWRGMPFSQGERVPGAFAARVNWASLDLSPLQGDRAQRRITQVIAYLSDPTFAAYYRLRTENLQFRFTLEPWAAELFAGSNATIRSLSPRDATKAVWEAVLLRSKAAATSRLTGICLDNIAAVTTATNSVPAMLSGKLFKWITIARKALNPGFGYGVDGQSPSAPNKLFLDLSFYARSSTSTNPGPVHLSVCWSESDSDWTLNQMLTDVHLNMETLF
jgi:hypothetical protein